jgi:hypothetical protein
MWILLLLGNLIPFPTDCRVTSRVCAFVSFNLTCHFLCFPHLGIVSISDKASFFVQVLHLRSQVKMDHRLQIKLDRFFIGDPTR